MKIVLLQVKKMPPYKATISDKEKDDLEYFSIKAENELGKLLKSKQSEDDDDEEEN